MNLTVDQVLGLAPDASSAAAARKLGAPKPWQNLGQSEKALWGECQGSALYQVRIDLNDLASKCTCPSRKFPCKHALGLLLVAASAPASIATASAPEWVSEWLTKRSDAAEKKEARAAAPAAHDAPEKAPDPAAQAKRAEQRLGRMLKGMDALDTWLADLARNGLARVETEGPAFWEAQAARLVDAQAPSLASRVRRVADLVGGDASWPARVLDALGRIALVTHAFRRIDALPEPLQAELRQLVGFPISQEELAAQGTVVHDTWHVVGQVVEDDERIRMQRTWLWGARTAKPAMVLQFAPGSQAFAENLVAGTSFEADVIYYPGVATTRVALRPRAAAPSPWGGGLPGFDGIDAFLDDVATHAAENPWLDRTLACLRDVVPVPPPANAKFALVRDGHGAALKLAMSDPSLLFALSGGAPIDLAAEWDGSALAPLAVVVDGTYYPLRNASTPP